MVTSGAYTGESEKQRAIIAIGEIGCRSEKVESILVQCAKTDNLEIVTLALLSLNNVFVNRDRVAKEIKPLIKHSDPEIRSHAIFLAGNLRSTKEDFEGTLVKRLNDNAMVFSKMYSKYVFTLPVRLIAIRSLGKLRNLRMETLDKIENEFDDQVDIVRIEAAKTHLLKTKTMNIAGLKVFKSIFRNHLTTEKTLCFALERIEGVNGKAAILTNDVRLLLEHKSLKVRKAAISAIAALEQPVMDDR